MAREKNGYMLLYSSILDKDFSLAEFKIWVGLLLLANHRKAKEPGLIDLPLRDIATRLKVSLRALVEARNKFIKDRRVELVSLEGKTKPIAGIRILNYEAYRDGKIVLPDEQSNGECSLSRTKNVHYMIQNVIPSRTISKLNQSCVLILNKLKNTEIIT